MIYKRQDFCYRLVQFRRHRLSHIHVCIQHSGKWFVFYDFYLMLPGDLFKVWQIPADSSGCEESSFN